MHRTYCPLVKIHAIHLMVQLLHVPVTGKMVLKKWSENFGPLIFVLLEVLKSRESYMYAYGSLYRVLYTHPA